MLLHKKITALCCIVFLLAGVGGYTADAAINTEVGSLSGMPLPAPKKSETGKKITLNLASRLLTLYEGTEKVRIYPVAVGAPETPSPVGEFSISEKEVNPVWTDPKTKTTVPSGPSNPLGYRWLGLYGNYGIHGTNAPWSIGCSVSHGCIRMYEEDVEELFESAPMGTPVEIIYDRVIMEEAPDHTVSYYIYPDGYGWEPLTVSSVKEYLARYGVEDFAMPDEVYHKIIASDGSVTYVAKHYDLIINGRKLKKKAIGKDGSIWIPAVETSVAAKVGAYWDGETNTLMTRLGKVPGIVKSDVVYINEKDLESVFHIKGRLTEDLVYEAESLPTAEPVSKTIVLGRKY